MSDIDTWINNKKNIKYKPKIIEIDVIKDFIFDNICLLFPNCFEHYNGIDYFEIKIILDDIFFSP